MVLVKSKIHNELDLDLSTTGGRPPLRADGDVGSP